MVVALTVLMVTTILLFAFGVTYTRWWLRKQLRIRPSTRSVAPSGWLVGTSEPARRAYSLMPGIRLSGPPSV